MGKIIAVHSFRGGTGKSNLVANVAVSVALEGKRVGVVDTDVQSPGIHVLFDVDVESVECTLNDYLWGRCSIEDAAQDVTPSLHGAHGRAAAKEGAVYLVPCRSRAGEIARVLREGYDVGVLNDGFRALMHGLHLDYLFIDTHPGLNEETLLSIAVADLVIVLLRPDKQDFQGTAVTVEVARKLEVPNLVLVINKVLPEYDLDDLRRHVETTYQTPVAGILPLSLDLVRLASGGIFCLNEPLHAITKEIGTIAARVMDTV